MSNEKTRYKFLFAGGGTGGHLFPAIAVAEKIKEMKPESEILFVGTKNRIEGIFKKTYIGKHFVPIKIVCFCSAVIDYKCQV